MNVTCLVDLLTIDSFPHQYQLLTQNCHQPGFLDVLVFIRLLFLLEPERARARDYRYLLGEVSGSRCGQSRFAFADDPGSIITERGVDRALEFATLAYDISNESKLQQKLSDKGFDLLSRYYYTEAGSASFYVGELGDTLRSFLK